MNVYRATFGGTSATSVLFVGKDIDAVLVKASRYAKRTFTSSYRLIDTVELLGKVEK